MQLSLVYTTFPSEEDAIKTTQELLKRRLVACINILGPVKSFYMWQGKLEENKESAVLLKTTPEKISALINALQVLHTYETPAILEIPVGKSALPFCEWVHQEVGV